MFLKLWDTSEITEMRRKYSLVSHVNGQNLPQWAGRSLPVCWWDSWKWYYCWWPCTPDLLLHWTSDFSSTWEGAMLPAGPSMSCVCFETDQCLCTFWYQATCVTPELSDGTWGNALGLGNIFLTSFPLLSRPLCLPNVLTGCALRSLFLLIFNSTESLGCQEDHGKEQKSDDFAFQVLSATFLFIFFCLIY
jgi:hypothetical protein